MFSSTLVLEIVGLGAVIDNRFSCTLTSFLFSYFLLLAGSFRSTKKKYYDSSKYGSNYTQD